MTNKILVLGFKVWYAIGKIIKLPNREQRASKSIGYPIVSRYVRIE